MSHNTSINRRILTTASTDCVFSDDGNDDIDIDELNSNCSPIHIQGINGLSSINSDNGHGSSLLLHQHSSILLSESSLCNNNSTTSSISISNSNNNDQMKSNSHTKSNRKNPISAIVKKKHSKNDTTPGNGGVGGKLHGSIDEDDDIDIADDIDDDGVSLYVNAKTENNDDASTIVTSHPNRNKRQSQLLNQHLKKSNQHLKLHHHQRNNGSKGTHLGTGGKEGRERSDRAERGGVVGSGRVVFRGGLSKSASRLLSQDTQTLSDLLNVDQQQQQQQQPQPQPQPQPPTETQTEHRNNTDDNNSSQANTSITAAATGTVTVTATANGNIPRNKPQHNHARNGKASSSLPSSPSSSSSSPASLVGRKYSNTDEGYIHHIIELEERLRQQEEHINTLECEWEQRLLEKEREMKKKHKDEIDEMQREINTLKQVNKSKTGGGAATVSIPKESNSSDCKMSSLSSQCKSCPKGNMDELVAVLTPDQISRYSRQLLLNDGFGVKGQQTLLSSTVLVVGAGGIGSTVLLYLAASGVGKIIIVDFDSVEKSNLHRQVIHCEANVGVNKALSACQAIKQLNPSIECIPVQEMFTYDNALDIISKHNCDCIVDACDNPQTRYICNDASILSKKPLISGSAMGTEGQLAVYGFNDSACYRCLYPKVNPSEGCKSCSDNGVLGTVPGLIGILQATETLKVLTGIGSTMHDRLLMYDAMCCSFLNIKKPPRRKDCVVCGSKANISMETCKELSSNARGPQKNESKSVSPLLKSSITPEMNISCTEYEKIRTSETPHVLLDVRVNRQFEMCSLSGAFNLELGKIESSLDKIERLCDGGKPMYCICRRGVASTEATRLISEKTDVKVFNIVGGYNAWEQEVDSSFPAY